MADRGDDKIVRLPGVAEPVAGHAKPKAETTENAGRRRAFHFLPVAASMVGVCAALVALVKVAEFRIGPSAVDEYSACAGVLFLASVITSYLSLRLDDSPRLAARLGLIADMLFIAGLVVITAVTMLFAYEVI